MMGGVFAPLYPVAAQGGLQRGRGIRRLLAPVDVRDGVEDVRGELVEWKLGAWSHAGFVPWAWVTGRVVSNSGFCTAFDIFV